MNSEIWQSTEDELLQKLHENDQNLTWQQIAIKIFEKLNFPKKSGKQCQKRFQLINKEQTQINHWTQQEENILIQKQHELGNRWATISQFLKEKNDNCVKNHFYSKLRKMFRKLNRLIHIYFKKTFKAIPNATIYKLVEASQERFKEKPICSEQVSINSQNIISKILKLSLREEFQSQSFIDKQKDDFVQYEQLIQQIYKASKNYKKKSKKVKNSSIKAPVRKSKNNKPQISKQFIEDSFKDDQNDQQQVEQEQSRKSSQKIQQKNFPKVPEAQMNTQQTIVCKTSEKKVQIKEGNEMQELLKNIGLLQEEKKKKKKKDSTNESGPDAILSYSDFQNPSSDHSSFFGDSNNYWKKESNLFTKMNKCLFGGFSSQNQ